MNKNETARPCQDWPVSVPWSWCFCRSSNAEPDWACRSSCLVCSCVLPSAVQPRPGQSAWTRRSYLPSRCSWCCRCQPATPTETATTESVRSLPSFTHAPAIAYTALKVKLSCKFKPTLFSGAVFQVTNAKKEKKQINKKTIIIILFNLTTKCAILTKNFCSTIPGQAARKKKQEIWANAHETRDSISIISYAGCLRLSPSISAKIHYLSVRHSLKWRKIH